MVTKTDNPCRMATANGITTADEQVSVHVNGINSAVDAVILDNSPCNVLSLGKLCMEKGFGFEWKPGEPPKLLLPDGTVRVLMVDQYVPVLASALVSEETEEANLKQESKDAPPRCGGQGGNFFGRGKPQHSGSTPEHFFRTHQQHSTVRGGWKLLAETIRTKTYHGSEDTTLLDTFSQGSKLSGVRPCEGAENTTSEEKHARQHSGGRRRSQGRELR